MGRKRTRDIVRICVLQIHIQLQLKMLKICGIDCYIKKSYTCTCKTDLYSPGLQAVHSVEPIPSEMDPGLQVRQIVDPVTFLK